MTKSNTTGETLSLIHIYRFEITSVEDVKGRRMYLEVMAKVVKPGG